MTREEAIKMLKSKMDGTVDTSYEWAETVRMAIEALHKTEAQTDTDEWCTDCAEYDHERHCCPRWNRVIRETLKDMQIEKRTEESTKTHACDLISRQAAIDEMSKQQTYKMFVGEDTVYLDANDVGSVLASLPSAQPTLYGYEIEHLAYIARVMQKEGVTAEYAVRTFGDVSRASRMIIEELQERVEKSLSAMQLPFVRKQKEEENR